MSPALTLEFQSALIQDDRRWFLDIYKARDRALVAQSSVVIASAEAWLTSMLFIRTGSPIRDALDP
jgi:hypothetical protein